MSQTVLVVDDDSDQRATCAALLAGQGFTVLEAVHGVEALAILRSVGGADLILLDWQMPVMNGLAFYVAFRNDPAIRHIPIVVVSGEAGVEAHARSIGAAASLVKPVPASVLLDTVRAVLSRYPSRLPPNAESF